MMNLCCERKCCACCMEMGSPPFVPIHPDDTRFKALPPELWEHVQYVRELQDWEDGVPCVWLNVATRRCVYYGLRPHLCREFEPGSEGCERNIDRENLKVAEAAG